MNRRRFVLHCLCLATLPLLSSRSRGADLAPDTVGPADKITKISKSEDEWRRLLTPAQFNILREAGTEPAFSSPLYTEKRMGRYLCAGCELPLFTSEMKYDSGTGWPSFYTTLPGSVETKLDFSLILPRREYHCARCGGHQGHVFTDGPKPTGQRWCNNGLALKFVPA